MRLSECPVRRETVGPCAEPDGGQACLSVGGGFSHASLAHRSVWVVPKWQGSRKSLPGPSAGSQLSLGKGPRLGGPTQTQTGMFPPQLSGP